MNTVLDEFHESHPKTKLTKAESGASWVQATEATEARVKFNHHWHAPQTFRLSSYVASYLAMDGNWKGFASCGIGELEITTTD